MAASKKYVTVEQHYNHEYCDREEDRQEMLKRRPNANPNDQYVYRVKSTKNCIAPRLMEYLTPTQVDQLINDGVEVNVVQVS